MALTTKQLRHLEHRLQEERARAQRELNQTAVAGSAPGTATEQDRSGDVASLPTHMADLGSDTMENEFEAANITRVSEELAEIDAALDRLHRAPERFGICEETGKPIPFARLDLIPWARTRERHS
ncbi:MAG TPA: TraR/DksA family transcriptional regulator [Gemmatimonadales bacterium]|nr:TraR/DksA family transcriptional regulator [Gemmatimonadales bacterium]